MKDLINWVIYSTKGFARPLGIGPINFRWTEKWGNTWYINYGILIERKVK
jgi:hypothetical protein